MNVVSNLAFVLSACASPKSFSLSTMSTLLRISTLGCRTSSSFARIASASSSRPFLASISTATTSASWAPVQAVVTIARSSLRLGANIPGVSMKMSWAVPSIAMPRRRVRVVCTLGVTMATLLPTSALISVDLPALGAPINAMKPQRVSVPLPAAGSAIIAFRLHALALEQRLGGGLLGRTLRAAGALGRLLVRKLHLDAKHRAVVRAGALDLAVHRGRQAARLRPFLQHRLRIAQRPDRRPHPLAPEPVDQLLRRRIPAIEIDRADQRLANIGEDRSPRPPAGVVLGRAEP